MREWKKIFHVNGNEKKAGVAIFISDKITLKQNYKRPKKKSHCIIIKGSIQEEDLTVINIYT